MQINGMPVSMNINLEREAKALNTLKTNNLEFWLAPIITALLYFKISPLPADLPSETLEVTRGMLNVSGWEAKGLGMVGKS